MKQDVTVKFAEHLIYSAGGYSYQRPVAPLVRPVTSRLQSRTATSLNNSCVLCARA